MPRGCDYCGKAAVSGNRVSHANNVTKRTWQPNLKSVRAVFDGAAKHVHVCTRCLRSGRVVKPTVRAAKA